MDLYIANCSKQDHAFVYRLPEQEPTRGHHKVDIPAGGQVRLANLSVPAKQAIIEAHEPYGLREISKVHRSDGFVGLAWSEKEISWDGIASAVEHNTAALDLVGQQLRDAAAVAADQSLLSQAPIGSELKATSVEVIEHETKDGDTKINERRTVKPAEDDRAPRRGTKVPGGR